MYCGGYVIMKGEGKVERTCFACLVPVFHVQCFRDMNRHDYSQNRMFWEDSFHGWLR